MGMMTLDLLILEDNLDDAELAVKELECKGFNVKWTRVDTEKAFRKALAQKPDLILADYSLPSFDGPAALKIHRQLDLDIPLIIVSGTIGEEIAVECMKSGATDYVFKDNLSRLGPVVKRALGEMKIYRKSKQSENALRESQERYRVLFETAKDAIFVSDETGRFVDVNQAACEFLGYSREELLKLSPKEIDADPIGYDAFIKVRDGLADKISFEINQIKKDGTHLPVEITGSFFNEKGQQRALAIARDITGRKLSEKLLRESEAKHRLLAENTVDCIWQMNLDLEFTYINQAIFQLLGYTTKEWIGSKLPEHCSSEEMENLQTLMTDLLVNLQDKTTPVFETSLYHKNGEEIPCEVSGKIVLDDAENPIYFQGTVRNITERRRAEQERKQLEAQLHQAQKMEAIGTLAGGIAHDFNNILTTIIGNTELALMDVIKDKSLRKKIEEIKKAGKRAASLTHQLLAFSRKQIVQPKILNINELLTDIEKMLGRLIGEDVELLTIPEPELWRVEIDPGQIEQVIMNLAVNARDAMPKGGNLTIETANADLDGNFFREHGIKGEKPGHYVMLTISDTGSGMDKETQKHIFEPFFTTKEVGKGTGLGLSTIYGIIKQNNGFVRVYSEPGQGSTFKVYLPRVRGNAEPEEKEQTPVDDLSGSETVLIVEDNDSLRNFAQKVLHIYGYRTLNAENGEDALRVCKEHDGQIDLMITDVVMPKMGGKKLSERLQPLYPQMKVIYMSGYTDNAIVHHGVLEPGLNFLEKPFTPESLGRKVREALGNEN
jgi:PAS domain S-box-containing protein